MSVYIHMCDPNNVGGTVIIRYVLESKPGHVQPNPALRFGQYRLTLRPAAANLELLIASACQPEFCVSALAFHGYQFILIHAA